MSERAAEGRRLHPVVDAVRGTQTRSTGHRLTIEHLEQRDRSLDAIRRANEEVARLEEIERGSVTTEVSPRLAKVREVKGELAHLGRRLDAAYV